MTILYEIFLILINYDKQDKYAKLKLRKYYKRIIKVLNYLKTLKIF